jgi:hypothetical protein
MLQQQKRKNRRVLLSDLVDLLQTTVIVLLSYVLYERVMFCVAAHCIVF